MTPLKWFLAAWAAVEVVSLVYLGFEAIASKAAGDDYDDHPAKLYGSTNL